MERNTSLATVSKEIDTGFGCVGDWKREGG